MPLWRPAFLLPVGKGLDQAELHLAFLRDHLLIPGWFPSDAYFRGGYAGHEEDFVLGVFRDGRAHATTRCGQRHGDIDFVAQTVIGLEDIHRINETEINDVHRDFWIKNFFELLPDRGGIGCAVGEGVCRDGGIDSFFPEGIGIFAIDADETGVGHDGVAAAESLRDEDAGAGRQDGRDAGGNLDGGYFAGKNAFFGHGVH